MSSPHLPGESATTVSAWAAVASPAWLPLLEQGGTIAGHILPILGVVWLLTQITVKITFSIARLRRDRKK